MGTDIDIFYIGRIEIRSSVIGKPVGSVAEDTVRTVCPQNGAEQVLDVSPPECLICTHSAVWITTCVHICRFGA